MSSFEHETISMEDLRAGFGKELLAEAEVVIAVDPNSQEEVVHGRWDWELAVGTGQEAELSVVRVELGSSDDLDELAEMLERARSTESGGEESTDDVDADD